ncbi:MAG TPA: acyl-CoA dehydrogenase family protein, partial [Dehalococcoidia bacterium]|nr:acyl-CoA dehydrogenase family protein [Dehalococcoidia bacterium]
LLVDMASPGVTVRPLRQITGESHFNEVYFDSVRVPKSQLLGAPNRGWYITVDLLSYERQFVGDTTSLRQTLAGLVRLAKSTRRNGGTAHDDPRVRARLADLAIAIEQVAQLGEIAFAAQLNGRPPGQEASMVKIIKTEASQRMAALAADLLGSYGPLWRGSPGAVENGRWAYDYLWSRAGSIYSGTNEILRTTIADRGLGLPR